jgi:hypothetical protein
LRLRRFSKASSFATANLRSEKPIHLFPIDLAAFVLFRSQVISATFRNIATL